MGKPKKLQVIVLQRKTPENKFARDLNNDVVLWTSVLFHWNELWLKLYVSILDFYYSLNYVLFLLF